jgi:hypothetical protein
VNQPKPTQTPPAGSRRTAPPPSRRGAAEGDLLQVLVKQRIIAADQVEAIRRAARLRSLPVEGTILALGLATEVQMAQALAKHAGLAFVTINPLDLDLDVVTAALSGPFARKHGLVATSNA